MSFVQDCSIYCYNVVSFICYFIVGVSGDYFVNLTSSGKFLLYVSARDVRAICRMPRGFMACTWARARAIALLILRALNMVAYTVYM